MAVSRQKLQGWLHTEGRRGAILVPIMALALILVAVLGSRSQAASGAAEEAAPATTPTPTPTPIPGAWQKIPTAHSPGNRHGHSLVDIGGIIYLFGGEIGDEYKNDLWAFVPEIQDWVRVPLSTTVPLARAYHSASVVGCKMIIHGGVGASGEPLADTWVYDPETSSWTQSSTGGPARSDHSAATVGDKMYVVGGTDSSYQPSGELWEFDSVASSWTKKQDYPTGGQGAYGVAAFTTGSKIVAGGNSGDNKYHVYDPKTNTWVEKTAINSPPARYSPGAASVGNDAYILGGEDKGTGRFRTDIWKADLSQETIQWKPLPPSIRVPDVEPEIDTEVDLISPCLHPIGPWGRWVSVYAEKSDRPLSAHETVTPSLLLYGCAWSYEPDDSHPFPDPIWGEAATWIFWPEGNPAGALAGISISPSGATLDADEQQLFSAEGRDAAGYYVPVTPTWTAEGGSINQGGKYQAGDLPGRYTVRAAAEGFQAGATVVVSGTAPCPDLSPGESCTHTFTVAGTYPYHDSYAPEYSGAVVVAPTSQFAPRAVGATAVVSITASGFEPPTVTIAPNGTVRWVNADAVTHTVGGGKHYYSIYLPLVLRQGP